MIEKADILAVISKYIHNCVGDDIEIDPNKSMVEYGANSLDIVEIVSRSMRELKIKIPRSELKDIPNIAGLVDVFYRCAKENEDAAAS